MMCDEFENRILAGPDNQLSDNEHLEIEKHLTECAGCRNLARQFVQLDAALEIKLKTPQLSSDFNQRLAKRIQAETTVLSDAERAERKRQLQAEYAAAAEQLRRGSVRVTSLLDGFSFWILAAVIGGLVWQSMPELTNGLTALGLSTLSQNLLLASAAGGIFLAIGLHAASPRLFKRLWSAI